MVSNFEYPFFEKFDNFPLKANKGYAGKIIYVLEELGDDLNYSISLSVIKSFNCLLHLKLFCIVPDSAISQLKQVANDNITFIKNTGDYSVFFSECDLLIGSNGIVVKGLISNLPVIVVGKYGFGGLVTNDNLSSFLPNHFSGRPGGHLGEKVSPVLLVHEINFVLELMNTCELDDLIVITGNNADSLKIYSWDYTFNSIKRIINEKKLLGEYIKDDSLMLQLKPTLSSAIVIDKIVKISEAVFWLRNVNTNKVLAVVSDFEMRVILQCNGAKSVSELVMVLGIDYNIKDCVEFLRALWELRAVFFRN